MKEGKGFEVGPDGTLEVKTEGFLEEVSVMVLKLVKVGSSSKVFNGGESVVVVIGLVDFLGFEVDLETGAFVLKVEREGLVLK